MTLPATIDEVLNSLDQIILQAKHDRSPVGYFASLYRRMTAAVLEGIRANKFQNADRMARLDVLFAGRYLTAYDQFRQQQPMTQAWRVSFEACRRNEITVIQHLLLGINAHINLDLGIAAALTSPGEAIHDLEKDFNMINGVIASLTRTVQDELTQIWFPMRLLDRITGNADDDLINFSIGVARAEAWRVATDLAFMTEARQKPYILSLDNRIAMLARKIENPSFLQGATLKLIRLAELNNPVRIIDILAT
ncbi:DUF5995 family protein [Arsenicibacter rosenii]|uniref:Uncharacterized protein n=1 Tax=Arsenicibacter rosenii TaxID=1750698 RepID=A0A1S2VCA1_9BACT|nr:DUF5995 family protein [Arsenicibacter rosenii]OIN56344.1 hypothetical protein BLX24_25280 [Arsenicibacter rosenii]